jgi:hypothetical protein
MKNKKLKLSDLKVQSFVTALNENEKGTIAGGAGQSDNPACFSNNPICASANPACNTNPAFCLPPFSCGRPDSLCPPPLDTNLQCL